MEEPAASSVTARLKRADPAWWWLRENFKLPAVLTIAGCVLSSGAWLWTQHTDLVELKSHDPGPKLEAIAGELAELLRTQAVMQQRLEDFAQRIDAQERRWEHVEEVADAPPHRKARR